MQENKSPSFTHFDVDLADQPAVQKTLSLQTANEIFAYFKSSPLFRWGDANNDCEDRANAACLLLDEWKIPNAKAWVFGGSFRKKEAGNLNNRWNYHVASALPIQFGNNVVYYVIDPATSSQVIPVDQWALQITETGTSYHFIKQGDYYIFPEGEITKYNWFKRNRRNYNWTMQGLSGINGASIKGKAQLAFKKVQPKKTEAAFKKLLIERPAFSTPLSP